MHWGSWCKQLLPLSSPTPMPPRTTKNQEYDDESKLFCCTIFMLLVFFFALYAAQQEIGSLREVQVDNTELIDLLKPHTTTPTPSSITTMYTEVLVLCARLH